MRTRSTSYFVMLALLTVMSVVSPLAFAEPASAGTGNPDVTLTKQSPAQVLYGETAPASLEVANETATWGYNLSFRDVLPPGVSYVAGSASLGGEPTVLANQPSAGRTTLLWENVADLAPQNTVTLSYEVRHESSPANGIDCNGSVLCVGESYTNTAGAFVNSDPRFVPDFNPTTGVPITGTNSFTGSDTDEATTKVVPFTLKKSEPSPEGELLRGVNDHATPYTLTVKNNLVRATNNYFIEDYLPAGLEFLGCGGVDNTTNAPTNPNTPTTPDPEYPGSGTLNALANPGNCVNPSLVETVKVDPDGPDGPLAFGVYTHVRWNNLGSLAPGAELVLTYLAGIPLRENVLFATGATPPTSGAQTANLNNNSGPETTDEQELTNFAAATGIYSGPVADNGSSTTTVTTELTRTAEDLAIQKTGAPAEVGQGDVVTWTLEIQTSEYRYVDNLVITDTLPNGLCPLAAGTDFDPSAPNECNASVLPGTPSPSTPYSTDAPPVENSDGTWTLTFDSSATADLARMTPSDTFTITVPTQVRSEYRQNGQNTTPVVSRDNFVNSVSIEGLNRRICAPGDPVCGPTGTVIDGDGHDASPVFDESEASVSTAADTIAKYVAAPVGNASPAACTNVTTWLGNGGASPRFSPGDRVCWRLKVDFSDGVDTRNPVVTDFIPPNNTYEVGSGAVLGANNVPIVAGDPLVVADTLTWRLGNDLSGGTCDPSNEVCFVEPGSTFDVVFSTIVSANPAAGNAFDLVENLMKYTSSNTAGNLFPLRDLVSYELAEPILALDKTNDAASAKRQGDQVTYTLKVTNSGNEPALNVEVWDLLPREVSCVDVTNAGGGTCTPNVGAADRLAWTIPGPIAPGASATRTYTVTLPAGATATPPVAAGDSLLNKAGVRKFVSETNRGTSVDYFPRNNIDPSVTPNTAPADDNSTVAIVAPSVTKAVTSLTSQAGNNAANPTNTSAQATIGETVRYTVVGSVPAKTSVYGATIRDTVSSRHSYVANSAKVTFPDGTIWNESDGAGALPPGYTFTPGPNLVLKLPAIYQNTDPTAVAKFTVTFDVTVDNAAANNLTSATIANSGRLLENDSLGNALNPVNSNTTNVSVVEPKVTVTKANNAVDAIQGGDTVDYTVSVTNSSATRVSTANDLKVTDTLPAGLTISAPTNISDSGTYNAGPPQTVTWNLTSLAPGASKALTYTVTADDSVVGGTTYTNDVKVVSTSMPVGDPQGTERTYTTGSTSDVEVVQPPWFSWHFCDG